MREPREVVVGAGSPPADDDLRLPRPPGVIRRFWTRHPLLADILIAAVAFLLTVPAIAVRSSIPEPSPTWAVVVAAAFATAGCVLLVWRRRRPVLAFAAALVPTFVVEPGLAAALTGPAAVIALYSIAVYRGVRACWIAFGVAGVLIVGHAAIIALAQALSGARVVFDGGTVVFLLLGAVIGINVGNRRRYLDALIERSRQLLVERDQQSQLAAAAERTRIAREMHDIVSHSLTVVVALADGASATKDPARAADATRAIAETARTALAEMRVMLGVLRDDDVAPLAPAGESTVHDIVAGARAAGAPVTLSITGVPDATPAVRLATLRIVAEGLTNALRYAQHPTRVHVDIVHRPDGVEVSVENDGAQPDAPSQGAGLGLRGLQERVAHVGGTMESGLVTPGVWRLHAVLPTEERP